MAKIVGIIVAAGKGRRLGKNVPKCFVELNGTPILKYSVQTFMDSEVIEEIFIMVPSGWENEAERLIKTSYGENIGRPFRVLTGGKRRVDTVKIALENLEDSNTVVAIHDGARVLLTTKILDGAVRYFLGGKWDGVLTAIPVRDTVKLVEQTIVVRTVPRQNLWLAQTPQVCRAGKLLTGINKLSSDFNPTDSSQIIEEILDGRVGIYEGSQLNFKITDQGDLLLAEFLLGGFFPLKHKDSS